MGKTGNKFNSMKIYKDENLRQYIYTYTHRVVVLSFQIY